MGLVSVGLNDWDDAPPCYLIDLNAAIDVKNELEAEAYERARREDEDNR